MLKILLKDLLAEIGSFKFKITLKVKYFFCQEIENVGTKNSPTIWFNFSFQIIINDFNIDVILGSFYQTIFSRNQY